MLMNMMVPILLQVEKMGCAGGNDFQRRTIFYYCKMENIQCGNYVSKSIECFLLCTDPCTLRLKPKHDLIKSLGYNTGGVNQLIKLVNIV